MKGNYEIPMDDPAVREVLSDLARKPTDRDMDALDRSLRLRGLVELWEQLTQCSTYELNDRPVKAWSDLFDALSAGDRPCRQVLALLADAGVLGTAWSIPACEAVWKSKGWS